MPLFNKDAMLEAAVKDERQPGSTPLSETFSTSLDSALDSRSMSVTGALKDQYTAYQDRIEEVTGQRLFNPYSQGGFGRREFGRRQQAGEDLEGKNQTDIGIELFHSQVAELAREFPELSLTTHDDLVGRVQADRKTVKDARARAEVGEEGFASGAAALAGGFTGAMTDPINIIALPLGANWATGVLRTALIEAGIGITSESLIQGISQTSRTQIGEEPDLKEAAANVALVGLGSAALGGGVKAAAKGVSSARQSMAARRATLEAAEQLPNKTPEIEAALTVERKALEVEEANPFGPEKGGTRAHHERLAAADNAVRNGRLPTEAELPAAPVNAGGKVYGQGRLDEFLDTVDSNPEGVSRAITNFKGVPEDVVTATETLAQMVKRSEGIDANDLTVRALGANAEELPGVIAPDGQSLDAIISRATDEGFFPDGQPTQADFLDALRREADGGQPTVKAGFFDLGPEQRDVGQLVNALEEAGIPLRSLTVPEAEARVRGLRQVADSAPGDTEAARTASTAGEVGGANRAAARVQSDELDRVTAEADELDVIREQAVRDGFAGQEDAAFIRIEEEDGTISATSVRDLFDDIAAEAEDVEVLKLCLGGQR